jgi:hypothetical protein
MSLLLVLAIARILQRFYFCVAQPLEKDRKAPRWRPTLPHARFSTGPMRKQACADRPLSLPNWNVRVSCLSPHIYLLQPVHGLTHWGALAVCTPISYTEASRIEGSSCRRTSRTTSDPRRAMAR